MTMGTKGDEKYGRPPFKPPHKHQDLPQENDLYPFAKMDFNMGDVHERYEAVLGPLTLFAPYPHEDAQALLENDDEFAFRKKKKEDLDSVKVQLERPVTPIDEEIKASPGSFSKLATLVRRRISVRSEVEYLGTEEQKELAAIIMGEVSGIWPDVRTQVDDPFLSPDENRELQRRITVHIVTVCQQLFNHYVEKAQVLQKRGVFSGPANMSRLKAQLALDANKFLNILMIRRYLVGELRHRESNQRSDSDDEGIKAADVGRKPRLPSQPAPLLSYKGLIDASRPKTKSKKKRYATAPEEVKKMSLMMPGLDTMKLQAILNDMPRSLTSMSSTEDESKKTSGTTVPKVTRQTSEDISRNKLTFKKSDSLPHLAIGENLLEELGVTIDSDNVKTLEDVEHQLLTLRNKKEEAVKTTAQPGTLEYAAQDLKRLVGGKREEEETTEEDLPPLLQAMTRSSQHDNKKEMLQEKLEELEERERIRQEKEKVVLREATHTQPATVSTKLPNKMVARTSDVRVSERVCLSSITLEKSATIYNDIIDEIDAATVKKLDSNLFLGDEITEVYTEIMKTVSTDHLRLENDDLIEPTADMVDLNGALASSSLSKRPSERLINPNLHKDTSPPWGNLDIKDWAKTPVSPPKDVRGRPLVIPMTPRGEGRANTDFFGEGYEPPAVPEPKNSTSMMQEMMARSYASWLTWWKNLISTDDYMKFISTQESDYLGVVFHFYNSDDEDIEPVSDNVSVVRSTRKFKQQIQEEKQKKLDEMKVAKSEYKEGFWNANSVLLGGLGKDPNIEEEEMDRSTVTPESLGGASLFKTGRVSRNKIFSRRSHKSYTTPRNGTEDGALSPDHTKGRSRDVSSPYPSRTGTKISSTTNKPEDKPAAENGPQEHLEKVWTSLQMPDHLKLDMAIKYSADEYHTKLDEAIEDWKRATILILKREEILAKLEKFERLASDPNRFFERGYRGSSVARLEEAKLRSTYYKKIDSYDREIKAHLLDMKRDYNDTVTYQGRPYLDKIQWDKTEMLFWLQEERKQQAIEYESRLRNITPLPVHLAQLEPLPSNNMQSTAVP